MLPVLRLLLVTLAAILSVAPTFALHPGADTDFGSNAIAVVATPGYSSNGSGGEHAIVAGDGRVTIASFSWGDFAVTRLLADGAVDPSFNGGLPRVVQTGIARMTAFGFDSAGRAMVVGGEYDTTQTILVLYRLTISGELDPTFGMAGKLRTILPANVSYQGVVPATPTVVVGRSGGGFMLVLEQGAVVAFDAAGTLDTSMWQQGLFRTSYFPVGPNTASSSQVVAVTASGFIHIAEPVVPIGKYQMKRVRPDGSVDADYGGEFYPQSGGVPKHGKFDSQGRLYFLFYEYYGGTSYSLVRLRADGFVDTSYGSGGYSVQPMVAPWEAPESLDVAGDGRSVVSAPYSFQPSSATATYRLFDANGQNIAAFGGRGITRVEQSRFGYSGFVARKAIFNASNDRLLIHGYSSQGAAISVIRLRLSFIHQISVSNPRTLPANPKYGDYLRFTVDVDGDQGRPTGTLTMRVNGAVAICVENLFADANDPDHSVTCTSDRLPVGGTVAMLEFSGDNIYLPISIVGPAVQIAPAKFTLYFYPVPNQPQLPKDRFQVSIRSWAQNSNGYGIASPIGGQFEITDGVSKCSIPAGLFLDFPGPECAIALHTPGNVRLYGRHVGDPNFETTPSGEAFVNVVPAISSVQVTDYLPNITYSASITTDDPNCGLKFGYADWIPEEAVSPDVRRSLARSGAYTVATVSDCTPGFTGEIDIASVAPAASLAAAWVRDQVNGWQRIATLNQRVAVPFVDNAQNDSAPTKAAGSVMMTFIPESGVADGKCIFDVFPAAAATHGRALLMIAAGFSRDALASSLGANWFPVSSWLDRVTCTSCLRELDINGNGQFDTTDAHVMVRRYQGLSLAQATDHVLPAQSLLGVRSASEAQAFIANGCR